MASPQVPWESAQKSLTSSCMPFCRLTLTKSPVVELVRFSDDQYMVSGSNSPIYRNVLAYIVIWKGVPCVSIGGPTGVQPDAAANMKCDDFFLVSATTGRDLDLAYQFGPSAPA
jgi:hypothetical protein